MAKKKKRRDDDDRMTRKQKVALAAEIYGHLVDGDTDAEIMKELNVSADDYAAAKKILLASKGEEEEGLNPKERFARYIIEQERNMVDLTDLVNNLNSSTQYSAIVGAIRMRSEIADKIISTGQTLGIVAKEPERRLILGGISIGDMNETDLRKGVLDAIGGLGKMIERYGTSSNIRALSPGTLHHGEAVEGIYTDPEQATLGKPSMVEASPDKKNRAKSGRRSAGRRRVRD